MEASHDGPDASQAPMTYADAAKRLEESMAARIAGCTADGHDATRETACALVSLPYAALS